MRRHAFATSLATHYTREKNRIVFKGTYSLNELALMIGEKTHDSFDASALSKVLTGKRLFTAAQLTAFSRLLRLTKKETDVLERSLAKDILSRHVISPDILRRKSTYTTLLEYFAQQGVQYLSYRSVQKTVNECEYTAILTVLSEVAHRLKNTDRKNWMSMDAFVGLVHMDGEERTYFVCSPRVFTCFRSGC